MACEYDAIVIGTGAGGGTLALHLAQAGKKILILERGGFLPQEKLNWDTSAVFLDNRYHTKETWQDKDGKDLHPQQAYCVGGQTKVYGAAMFRMRAEDFGVIRHKGGISPAWPISYADMEPYYTRAEELFHVHGDLARRLPFPAASALLSTRPNPSIRRSILSRHFPTKRTCKRWKTLSAGWGSTPSRCLWDSSATTRDPARLEVHSLRHMRRLSLPGSRQVRRRHQLHPADHASAERHPDDEFPGHAPADQWHRNGRYSALK